MKLKTFAKRSVALYLSGKSIYLRSAPGRGKTTTILESVPRMSAELGKRLGVVVINGPLLTPADAVGYLVPKTFEDGHVESLYTDPFWWRTAEGRRLEEYDGGVIFIDEADKMDVDIKKVIGEMALSGRCGPHVLPKGWVVWMAGNRQGDRSGSTKELDHLINRRFEVDITDDIEGWEEWANKNHVHHVGIAFARQNPQIVFPDSLPKEQGPFCTPRSLVATLQLLQSMSEDGKSLPTDTDAVEFAGAGIGRAAAGQLFAMLRLDSELPDIQTIINNPGAAKVPTQPDAQMLTAYKLASLSNKDTLKPFITYIERMPADFGATYAKSVISREPMLIANPAMTDWTKRNNALMTTLTMLSR